MVVVWEDDFHDTSKILTAPDSRKRFIQLIEEGLVSGDSIAESVDMETLALVNAFFNDQTIGGGSSIFLQTSYPASYQKELVTRVLLNESVELTHQYKDGGNYVGGWDDFEISVYIYIDAGVRDTNRKATFRIMFQGWDGTDRSANQFTASIQIDWDTSHNFLVERELSQGTHYTDSGIPIVEENQWVKMTIKKVDGMLYYVFRTTNNVGEQTSEVTCHCNNMVAGIETTILWENTGVAGTIDCSWDQCEIKTHLEQNDDDTNWPDHQHEFKTIDITPANLAAWQKINLTKSGESLTSRKLISCSVLDDVGAIISGYDDLTDAEIDLTGLDVSTYPTIALHIKFRNENGYDSPFLSKLQVKYFVTGGEVTIAVTANTYNSDIVAPIDTKTTYRLTFDATAIQPADPDVTIALYWFEFGDGLNSGWIESNIVNHIYNKHSQDEVGNVFESRVRTKDSLGNVSGWSNVIDVDVANSNPKAILWMKPKVVVMSGAGPSAQIGFFGHDSVDVDDNGSILTSGGYKFDTGDGMPSSWQDSPYKSYSYTSAGIYTVGLTVKDDLGAISTKVTERIRIKNAIVATLLVLSRSPRQVDEDFEAEMQVSPTLRGGNPEVNPGGGLDNTIKLSGQAQGSEADITLIKQYYSLNTLIQVQYLDTGGVIASVTGYITSLSTNRIGGWKDSTNWNITIQFYDPSQ